MQVAALTATKCWPWHLRALSVRPWREGRCRYCAREIALPTDHRAGFCVYCGLDRGLIEARDAPFGGSI